MKKVVKLSLFSLLFASLAFAIPTNKSNQTDAYFFDNVDFVDTFDGKEIKNNWIASNDVTLKNQHCSLLVEPDEYEWGGHIVLNDKKITESCTITYDFKRLGGNGWFAFSYGSAQETTAFHDVQNAFIFDNNGFDLFKKQLDNILNRTGIRYPVTPLSPAVSERCTVIVDLDRHVDAFYNVSYEGSVTIQNGSTVVAYTGDEKIHLENIDGYIGFNTNMVSAEIFSIRIDGKDSGTSYIEDFSDSGCSYSTKTDMNAKWVTNTFSESSLKVGKKNRLNLNKIDSYATYISPISIPANKNIGHIFRLEAKVALISEGVDTGFEIGKSTAEEKGNFVGLRKTGEKFCVVTYDLNGQNETITKNVEFKSKDYTVNLTIDVYRTGKVEITSDEITTSVSFGKIDGYFAVATRNHLGVTGGDGGMICTFEFSSSRYRERISSDMFQNFNGVKTFTEYGFDYHEFFYNKETWYTGSNIKITDYSDLSGGNGYLKFTECGVDSAVGPRIKFAEAIVRFDIELTGQTLYNGEAFGLQFAKPTIGTVSTNAPHLGLYCGSNESGPGGFSTFINYHSGATVIKGPADDQLLNNQNQCINLFQEGSKYTFLYIIRNNIVSMSFKTPEENESVLGTPKAVIKVDNTDGYISVFGTNRAKFNIDNLSIINLDYYAPKESCLPYEENGTFYQGATRYDFSSEQSFDQLVFDNAKIESKKLNINQDGSVSTKNLISNNLLRFQTKALTDTLRISRGSISIDLISGSQNKIVVNDGVNTQTVLLDEDFNFDGANFEILNSGSTLEVSCVSGLDPLSKLSSSINSFTIVGDGNYDKLKITSIGGHSQLLNYSIFNIDSKVNLPTHNFDPAKDESDPWPYRESLRNGLSPLAIGLIIGGSVLVAGAITATTIILVKKGKKKNEK